MHHGMVLRHIDIIASFFHEPYGGRLLLYVKGILNFDGERCGPEWVFRVRSNVYGTRNAQRIFAYGLARHLRNHSYEN